MTEVLSSVGADPVECLWRVAHGVNKCRLQRWFRRLLIAGLKWCFGFTDGQHAVAPAVQGFLSLRIFVNPVRTVVSRPKLRPELLKDMPEQRKLGISRKSPVVDILT